MHNTIPIFQTSFSFHLKNFNLSLERRSQFIQLEHSALTIHEHLLHLLHAPGHCFVHTRRRVSDLWTSHTILALVVHLRGGGPQSLDSLSVFVVKALRDLRELLLHLIALSESFVAQGFKLVLVSGCVDGDDTLWFGGASFSSVRVSVPSVSFFFSFLKER